jgi:hypothetical protein
LGLSDPYDRQEYLYGDLYLDTTVQYLKELVKLRNKYEGNDVEIKKYELIKHYREKINQLKKSREQPGHIPAAARKGNRLSLPTLD